MHSFVWGSKFIHFYICKTDMVLFYGLFKLRCGYEYWMKIYRCITDVCNCVIKLRNWLGSIPDTCKLFYNKLLTIVCMFINRD